MRADLLDQYERQVEVEYEGETYSVRDNGAVCRKGRPVGRKRRLDDVWTFGRPSPVTGYMHVSTHVVHRIVALAFHNRPSREHVVDHIDTNRRNNRADNLRWVTRLENVLLNPISLKRIVQCYGSLDAFFADPSSMKAGDPDFSWMRTVTKEEAEESRRRLLEWATSDRAARGGQLGEWLLRSTRRDAVPIAAIVGDQQSPTPMATQRNWRTLSEFPGCPSSLGSDPLIEYAAALRPGTPFSRNAFGETITERTGHGPALLAVVAKMPETSVKAWAVAKVTLENGKFVHESLGSYFSLEGAVNAYSRMIGIDPPYEDTIDDHC